MRHAPGVVNTLFRLGLTRYAPRSNGTAAPASLTADLRRVGLVAGGAIAAMIAGVQLWGRKSKRQQSMWERV